MQTRKLLENGAVKTTNSELTNVTDNAISAQTSILNVESASADQLVVQITLAGPPRGQLAVVRLMLDVRQ